MSWPRPVRWLCVVLVLSVAGAVPAHYASLWALRTLYQFGEAVGITAVPPAPGASLGGQVLGYNYARPPHWWGFLSGVLSTAIPLAAVFAAVLWLQSREWIAPRRPRATRLAAAAILGGLCAGVLGQIGHTTLTTLYLGLGEALGGTVARISGLVAWGPAGPFSGSTWADSLGNRLVRWGPRGAIILVGAAVALLTHRLGRRPTPKGLCAACGYDRSGIARDAPCPECGSG